MTNPAHISQATTEAHVRLIAPLFDEYRVFYGQTPDPEASYRFLRARWIARESVLFFSLDDEGNALGFVHLYPCFLSDRMLRLWILNDLYVKRSERRNGTARALMRRAEQYAAETGAAGLTLSTATGNTNAQALYESEGYVRDDSFVVYNRFLAL